MLRNNIFNVMCQYIQYNIFNNFFLFNSFHANNEGDVPVSPYRLPAKLSGAVYLGAPPPWIGGPVRQYISRNLACLLSATKDTG